MTLDEADDILDQCEGIVDIELTHPHVILDGQFTIQEVEAVLVMMRAYQPEGDESV